MTHSYYDMVNESIRWHEQQIKDASDDIARVANNTTKFVAPASMEAELPQAELVAPGDACEPLAGVRVEAVPAYNPHKKFHPKANGWVGYVVTTLNGIRVYIAGDTDDLPQNRKIACDIALVPAGGTYTMDAREAATFINALKPAIAFPSITARSPVPLMTGKCLQTSWIRVLRLSSSCRGKYLTLV